MLSYTCIAWLVLIGFHFSQRFFSSPKRPDPLLAPPTRLSDVIEGPFSDIKTQHVICPLSYI